MLSVSLRRVAQVTGGDYIGPDRLDVSSVGSDTRDPSIADLFVALKGRKYDGHEYLEDAVRNGSTAALVARRSPLVKKFRESQPRFPLVLVKDTLRAMGDLAAYVRGETEITVVGITGTTGKTCTKDYLVSILANKYRVAASPGSYNNEIGLPLTIFRTKKKDQVLVTEMGARHPGDIKRLCEIAKPIFGIITNVGPGHLELFKTQENIAATKAELARALPVEGTLILNADNQWSKKMARQTKANVVRFGMGRGADYRGVRVSLNGTGRPVFELQGHGFHREIRLPGSGMQQIENAVAAAACAHAMGLDADEIARGLERAKLSPWRMEVTKAEGGYLVINDAYNANPDSMKAALETLETLGSKNRTIAVLGAMAELGKDSREFHEAAGRSVSERDVDILVTVGRRARLYASAAITGGIPRGSVFRCNDKDEAARLLKVIVEPGDVILVKASRVVGLEALAEKLCEPGFLEEKLVTNV